MPRKSSSTLTSGPKSLFKKRSSLGASPIGSLRSSSWSVPELFKTNPIDDFIIEELGGKSGHLVYGPVSVFNGQVSMTVKSRIPNVTVSVNFRGLTEYNGRTLAFLNVTEVLWTGDLEPGPKNFLFALKFPPVNLPPSSHEPYIEYSFIAQIKPVVQLNLQGATLPELRTYTSKAYQVSFMPYLDPFAKERPQPKPEPIKLPSESLPPFRPTPPARTSTGGRPLLTLKTENLPPSPTLAPIPDQKLRPPSNPGVEKSAVILDGSGKIVAKLKVTTAKSKFVPGDEVKVTIILTLPKGVAIPKNYSVKIVERRTLGFASDEDAELVDTGSEEGDKPVRKSSSGKIFNRVLTQQKYPFSRNAVPIENRPASRTTSPDGLEHYNLDSGIEITDTLSVKLPSFKTFIDDSLLPSASLPLGPSARDTTIAAPSTPMPSEASASVKGKEIVRPASAPRPQTSASINSNKSTRGIEGLTYIVAHFLNVNVPLFSGTATSLIRKSSGTLDVDLALILGNKTPDVYSYQPSSVRGSMEVLKVSTPELVVIPPGAQELLRGPSQGLGSSLRHQESRTSFKREPSPLRGVGLGVSGIGNGHGNTNGNGSGSGSGPYGFDGVAEGSGYSKPPPMLRPASSRVSFKSFRSLDGPAVGWKKGEKFPTLEETEEKPGFLAEGV